MEKYLIPLEEFQRLTIKVEQLTSLVQKKIKKPAPDLSDEWISIDMACKILKISRRTFQKYRDQGIIPFSQYQNKILVKASDIQKHLEKHYRPAYNRKEASK